MLSGNIKTFPLTDLLQWFSLSRKSGVLTITASHYFVKVLVKNGVLTGVLTNDPQRRIGQFLLSRGYINEEKLMKALNHQEEAAGGHLLGEILCREGDIDREKMENAIRERTEEIIYDLFLLDEGTFHFEDPSAIPTGSIELNLVMDFLVMEGIRRKDEWTRYREIIPTSSMRFMAVPGRTPRPDKVDDFARETLLMLQDGPQLVSDIIMATRRSPFDVYAALFSLYDEQCIEKVVEPLAVDEATCPIPSIRKLEDDIRNYISKKEFSNAAMLLAELRREGFALSWLENTAEWVDREEKSYLLTAYTGDTVPYLVQELRCIRQELITPREGFLISRLGEGMNVKMLCQIMPLGETEILRLVHSLRSKGVIDIRPGR